MSTFDKRSIIAVRSIINKNGGDEKWNNLLKIFKQINTMSPNEIGIFIRRCANTDEGAQQLAMLSRLGLLLAWHITRDSDKVETEFSA